MRKRAAAPSRRKKKFPGILDRPMVGKLLPPAHAPVLGGSISDEERHAAGRAISDQLVERFTALFKHYGILFKHCEIGPAVANPWRALAVSLALDLIPGFEIRSSARRGRGKPKKWDAFTSARLLADVARIRKRDGVAKISGENACRILMRQPGCAARYGAKSFKSLNRRYKAAKGIVRAGGLDWLVQVFLKAEQPESPQGE
jgi:hypothetical protein